MMGKSMPFTMQKFLRPSFKFDHLLIGYKSNFKDRLSISILASCLVSKLFAKIITIPHQRMRDGKELI